LNDIWNTIELDLEIIQTEGLNSCKIVDPNMVIKKKGGKDVEVQDGWVGHVIPFELIQITMLKDKADILKEKESNLISITEQCKEIGESLSEEDKECDFFNKNNNTFTASEVTKEVKRINKEMKQSEIIEESIEKNLLNVNELLIKEKELKKQAKALNDELTTLTKKTIENLSEKQIEELLKLKWISPIVSSLSELPNLIIKELTAKIKKLNEKYATTFLDVENQILKAEDVTTDLLNDLVGDEFDMKGISELKSLLKGDKNA
jgi:type I restriction enzyme M protein